MTPGERLVTHWKGQPVRVRPPLDDNRLEAFERKYGVMLPNDVKDYFTHADGFDQVFEVESGKQYWDKKGFNFYPLGKVVPIDVIEDGAFSFPGSKDFYVFADYLDWCWGYAVRFGAGPSTVVKIGERDKPILVSETFADFIDRYIVDDSVVYEGLHGAGKAD